MVYTDWEARHGLSNAQFQNAFDDLNSQGYRLVKVSVFADDDEAHYAGIWQKRTGNDWVARNGLTASQYQVAINDFLQVLSDWGPCPGLPAPCAGDLTGDDLVDILDFLEVLDLWGPCP